MASGHVNRANRPNTWLRRPDALGAQEEGLLSDPKPSFPLSPVLATASARGRLARRRVPEANPCCRVPKKPCGQPTMRGKRVCRLHGGKGGGLKGEKNGAYRTGRYTAEAKAERRQMQMLIRGLRHLIDSSE